MMRGRFADIDGDGHLDFVGSAYAVQCADGEHTTCGNRGVWGWWYRSAGRERKRLETPVLASSRTRSAAYCCGFRHLAHRSRQAHRAI